MIVERPDERQWQDLVRTYGSPEFFDRVWSLPERSENIDAPTCSGEVILIIFNLASSCIFVRKRNQSDWFFPMGRIEIGEGIIEAARREALEEVGVRIEPVGVPLCQRVTLTLKNTTFQRWQIVVIAETASSDLDPSDKAEIEEARFFDIPPLVKDITLFSQVHELHNAGTSFMRSLDAMDGI